MAYKEVTVEKGEGGGKFVSFDAIGDKVEGYFAGTSASSSKYAAEKPGIVAHHFLTKEGMVTCDPLPTDAVRKLAKADREGDLKIGCKVEMVYTGDLDTGQKSPMKVIRTRVDPEVKPAAVAAITKAKAAPPPPPPKPKPAPASDDPFADDDIPL